MKRLSATQLQLIERDMIIVKKQQLSPNSTPAYPLSSVHSPVHPRVRPHVCPPAVLV